MQKQLRLGCQPVVIHVAILKFKGSNQIAWNSVHMVNDGICLWISSCYEFAFDVVIFFAHVLKFMTNKLFASVHLHFSWPGTPVQPFLFKSFSHGDGSLVIALFDFKPTCGWVHHCHCLQFQRQQLVDSFAIHYSAWSLMNLVRSNEVNTKDFSRFCFWLLGWQVSTLFLLTFALLTNVTALNM